VTTTVNAGETSPNGKVSPDSSDANPKTAPAPTHPLRIDTDSCDPNEKLHLRDVTVTNSGGSPVTLIDKGTLCDLLEPLGAGERVKVLDEIRTQLETLRVFLLQKQDLVTSSTANGHKKGSESNGESKVKTSSVIVKHDSAKENGVTTSECSGGPGKR
jgi:hypothetical protein